MDVTNFLTGRGSVLNGPIHSLCSTGAHRECQTPSRGHEFAELAVGQLMDTRRVSAWNNEHVARCDRPQARERAYIDPRHNVVLGRFRAEDAGSHDRVSVVG